jgi:hypothetical protein
MREIRPYGSEGGVVHNGTIPTPIEPNFAQELRHFLGSGGVLHAAKIVLHHPQVYRHLRFLPIARFIPVPPVMVLP